MSSEGKILSILISKKSCIIKEISGLAGVSQRATYNCLKKFEEMGVIKRTQDHHDRRFQVVSIDQEAFCKEFCGGVSENDSRLPSIVPLAATFANPDTSRTGI